MKVIGFSQGTVATIYRWDV